MLDSIELNDLFENLNHIIINRMIDKNIDLDIYNYLTENPLKISNENILHRFFYYDPKFTKLFIEPIHIKNNFITYSKLDLFIFEFIFEYCYKNKEIIYKHNLKIIMPYKTIIDYHQIIEIYSNVV